jgi:hypothetical protein
VGANDFGAKKLRSSVTKLGGRVFSRLLTIGIFCLLSACQPPNLQGFKIPTLKIPTMTIPALKFPPVIPERDRENDRGDPEVDVVVESRIKGDFDGWDGDTIFELANGQIWQQSRYGTRFASRYRPKVTIYRIAGGHEMEVEGVSSRVRVERVD